MGQHHRDKIAKSVILDRLIKCAEGKLTMSSNESNVGIALLRKIMPDMASVEHSGDVQTTYVARMPEAVKDMAEWRALHMGSSPDLPAPDTDNTKH